MIEKHLTLDRTAAGPDHAASLEPETFGAMVEAIRSVSDALGDGVKQPAAVELPVAAVVRRSLFWARSLASGEAVSRRGSGRAAAGVGVGAAASGSARRRSDDARGHGRTAGRGPGHRRGPRPFVTDRRVVGVLTTGRQDWGIVHSTCVAIRSHATLSLRLVAGGTHGATRRPATLDVIRDDGFEPDVVLPWDDDPSTTPARRPTAARHARSRAWAPRSGKTRSTRCCWWGTGSRPPRRRSPRPSSGSRSIHLHGGEQTFGAFDDALRHAITKLSHLHLVSHEEHRRRVDRDGRGSRRRSTSWVRRGSMRPSVRTSLTAPRSRRGWASRSTRRSSS